MKTLDIHIHGIDGYDTKTTDVNHILKIAEIEGTKGVSEIILAVYPSTIKVMRESISVVKEAMDIQNKREDYGKSARIIGVHLEGPFLNPSRCGALNAMTFIEPSEIELMRLIEGYEDIIRIITIAPEMDGALKLIKRITDMGIIVSMGHSDASYSEAEAGFNAGAKGITHIFNGMRGFHHREPGIAGFGLINRDVYIEVIADPFHLHKETLRLIFGIKNSDRIILISDSVKETRISGRGVFDKEGRLIGGSETIMDSSMRLIQMGFSEDVIIKCISENPQRYLNFLP